jgi:hypothetical protein
MPGKAFLSPEECLARAKEKKSNQTEKVCHRAALKAKAATSYEENGEAERVL